MISSLLLAAALAAQTPPAGAAETWHLSQTADGRQLWVWGWRDELGWIRYFESKNPQMKPPAAAPVAPPKPAAPVNLGAGLTLETNGSINAGLDLKATQATGAFSTNDPAFLDKIESQGGAGDRCPNDEPGPDPSPPPSVQPALAPSAWAALAFAVGVIVALLASHERRPPPPTVISTGAAT